MTQTELIILAIALTAESFASSWYTGALHARLGEKPLASIPPVIAAVRSLMLVAGFLAGWAVNQFFNEHNLSFGLILIFITGLKIMTETYRFNPEAKIVLIDNFSTLVLWSLAGSFNVFLAGAGAGMAGAMSLIALILFFVITIPGSYAGLWMGKKRGISFKSKLIVLIAGLVIAIVPLRLLISLLF